MVENVEWALGNVVVALRMTSPLCHALPYFQMEIERVVAGIPGVVGVTCTFDHGGNWQPSHMAGAAQRKLAERRELVQARSVNSARTGALSTERSDGSQRGDDVISKSPILQMAFSVEIGRSPPPRRGTHRARR
jgi:metal-sulfur cluster biosynthetic enzyme